MIQQRNIGFQTVFYRPYQNAVSLTVYSGHVMCSEKLPKLKPHTFLPFHLWSHTSFKWSLGTFNWWKKLSNLVYEIWMNYHLWHLAFMSDTKCSNNQKIMYKKIWYEYIWVANHVQRKKTNIRSFNKKFFDFTAVTTMLWKIL